MNNVPQKLGKADPALNKMTTDEIKQIHIFHKREAPKFAELAKKSDFEINQEDSDEDFAGPALDLFQSADLQESMGERKRKDNGILSSVKDVDSSEEDEETAAAGGAFSTLPISHEVILAGH